MKNRPKILSFINLDIYPIYRAVIKAQARTALQGSIDASCRASMNNTFHT